MKIKERQCHITKQLVHSFSVNIERMHQLYNTYILGYDIVLCKMS